VVTVATMHKAKGLEWDRVYLLSVNNYDFPSGQTHDTYLDEPWFVRQHWNLPAETLALLEALARSEAGGAVQWPTAGEATRQARLAYVSERLRLLYVSITRARRALTITWNKGRRQNSGLQPATPLLALRLFWDDQRAGQDAHA
jgi:DNA helicase-2/ATP-dependent DNA helicase PcrA